MFKVVKCPQEYIEIRKRLRAQESAIDTVQAPSIQDRTINDQLSMFVEVKNGKQTARFHSTIDATNCSSLSSDGTDLSTPRVFKIHPNTTYVGRDAKAGVGKQYFYVSDPSCGCRRNEALIEYSNLDRRRGHRS